MSAQTPLSVSAATAIIKDRLEDLPAMTVEGEVSNLRPPGASGHLYFTLGDDKAKLNAAFFRFRQQRQIESEGALPDFKNGDKVCATGTLSLYAPHGSYHLNVTRLERRDGTGDLLLRFEALRRKLTAEGLCSAERKRPLPLLPRRVGIVTAPNGAAIRDILNILSRRYPDLHILIAPCRVQGQEATEEIARAIELLNAHFGPNSAEPLDAMIVGRGGGSLEDLWCFNEERVARAVAASKIPVISAVGHEPDIAITDFVADLRAPTPSAAAELLCGKKEDFLRALSDRKERLIKALRAAYKLAHDVLLRHQRATLFRDPLRLLETRAQTIDALERRLDAAPINRLNHLARALAAQTLALERSGAATFPKALERLTRRGLALDYALQHALQQAEARTQQQLAKLNAFNPYAVLRRGYAIVTPPSGHPLTAPDDAPPGTPLTIRLAKGILSATAGEAQSLTP